MDSLLAQNIPRFVFPKKSENLKNFKNGIMSAAVTRDVKTFLDSLKIFEFVVDMACNMPHVASVF